VCATPTSSTPCSNRGLMSHVSHKRVTFKCAISLTKESCLSVRYDRLKYATLKSGFEEQKSRWEGDSCYPVAQCVFFVFPPLFWTALTSKNLDRREIRALGWLRLVSSLKLVSFAKEPYKRNDILPPHSWALTSRNLDGRGRFVLPCGTVRFFVFFPLFLNRCNFISCVQWKGNTTYSCCTVRFSNFILIFSFHPCFFSPPYF